MTIKMQLRLFLLGITLFLLTGCTGEDIDDCFYGLKLSFDFTLHNSEADQFGSEVHQVRVYLFDENGVLRKIARDSGNHLTNGYVMNIDIEPGRYTVISWAGGSENFDESYFEAHMNDAVTTGYDRGVTVGTTTIDNFHLMLNYITADHLPEDIVPHAEEFDELYYGAVGTRISLINKHLLEQVEVKERTIVERNIELIKKTNVLRVTISGLEYLQNHTARHAPATVASDLIDVWVSASNEQYKSDGSIGEYARSVRYTPYFESTSTNSIETKIKVLGLDVERHTGEPVLLTIKNLATGATYPSQPIDIVRTLLQAKDPQTGEYLYQSQEDFDREYEHPIELRINADLYIGIFVKDWEVVTLKPEI